MYSVCIKRYTQLISSEHKCFWKYLNRWSLTSSQKASSLWIEGPDNAQAFGPCFCPVGCCSTKAQGGPCRNSLFTYCIFLWGKEIKRLARREKINCFPNTWKRCLETYTELHTQKHRETFKHALSYWKFLVQADLVPEELIGSKDRSINKSEFSRGPFLQLERDWKSVCLIDKWNQVIRNGLLFISSALAPDVIKY